MANTLFLFIGGNLHFWRFERVIPTWQENLGELPRVSILIPAHNEAVVIEATLRSMLRLDYPTDKLEIIVINDNSSDNTGDIAREVAKKHPHIIVVDTVPPHAGKGKSSALNQGYKVSTGKYLAVYDADNTPEKEAIYNLVLGLENDKKAGAMVGKFRVANAKQTLLTRFINIETICFQWMAQAGRWFWFKMA